MRKYDSKNKTNIGIIVGICIVFAIIFSYFLVKEIKLSKIKFELEPSTLVFDVDKNTILLNEVGTIKKKWNKRYYLTYKEEQHQIGTHVIAFNNSDLSLTLYGEFYEVNKSSEVNITKEETKLNNLAISRFYKIADRKYLIVDSSIKSEDSSLQTENYLIIELDKLGNAILYNNKLNVKTFSETNIVTSTYTFDIANELLIYDGVTVDLKKILGTTNEYQKEEEKEEKPEDTNPNTGNQGDGGTGTGGNGSGDGAGGTGGNGQTGGNAGGNGSGGTGTGGNGNAGGGSGNSGGIDTGEDGDSITDSEIINQTAMTSIIKINPSVNSISVDYVIYDTLNKYLSTFVEVKSSKSFNTVHLSKSTTNVTIQNLSPGVKYTLTFKYTTLNDGVLKEEEFATYDVTTGLPNITLTGSKYTKAGITYKINVDGYSITSAKLRLYIDGKLQEGIEKTITSKDINVNKDFDLTGISTGKDDSLVTLSLEDIEIGDTKVNRKITWSHKKEPVPKEEGDKDEE